MEVVAGDATAALVDPFMIDVFAVGCLDLTFGGVSGGRHDAQAIGVSPLARSCKASSVLLEKAVMSDLSFDGEPEICAIISTGE